MPKEFKMESVSKELQDELQGLFVNGKTLQEDIERREKSHRKAEMATTIRDQKVALKEITERIAQITSSTPSDIVFINPGAISTAQDIK